MGIRSAIPIFFLIILRTYAHSCILAIEFHHSGDFTPMLFSVFAPPLRDPYLFLNYIVHIFHHSSDFTPMLLSAFAPPLILEKSLETRTDPFRDSYFS